MQAKYAVSDEGHWALASDCYCHFTSPIRRYPDLTVHRALAALEGWDGTGGTKASGRGRRPKLNVPDQDPLVETAARCSQTERQAEQAERELTKVKILTLLEKHIGEEFEGIVSSTADYGLFVAMPKYLVEGLVHTRDLQNDDYRFDRRTFTLKGSKRGGTIRIGDRIPVVIAAVDIPRRELNLAPAPGTDLAKPPDDTRRSAKRGKTTKGAVKDKPKPSRGARRGRRRR